jgi:hypothetical protein
MGSEGDALVTLTGGVAERRLGETGRGRARRARRAGVVVDATLGVATAGHIQLGQLLIEPSHALGSRNKMRARRPVMARRAQLCRRSALKPLSAEKSGNVHLQ